jgi:23S rRNA (pseudouridine1915-N3)-methyltransferase
MAEEFVKRTNRFTSFQMREIQPRRFDPWDRHPAAVKALLDPAGEAMDSARFRAWMERLEREARDAVFVIGGADGLPAEWRGRDSALLSLSAMTLPHELARVFLAEQVYRAFASLRGHPYPR